MYFPSCFPFPFPKVTTLSLPNVVTSLVGFVTACKSLWRLRVIAGTSDSKKPKLYYSLCLFMSLNNNLRIGGRQYKKGRIWKDWFWARVFFFLFFCPFGRSGSCLGCTLEGHLGSTDRISGKSEVKKKFVNFDSR